MKKFLFGALCGIWVSYALPEEQWLVVNGSIKSINSYGTSLKEWLHYYSPQEVNRRKSEEIRNSKNFRIAKRFVFEDKGSDRENVKFFTDLQDRMRCAEIVANQRGVTKMERIEIIRQTVKDHYPEMFNDYKEILVKEIETKIENEKRMN